MRLYKPSLTLLLASSFPLSSIASQGTPTLDNPFQTSFRKLPQKPCVSLFTRNGRVGCGTTSHEAMTGRLISWSAVVNSNYYDKLSDSLPKFVAVVDEYEYNAQTVAQIVALASSSAIFFGESVTDDLLDGLQNKVMFAYFQGENYRSLGSRYPTLFAYGLP